MSASTEFDALHGLRELLEADCEFMPAIDDGPVTVRTFEEAGVMTYNAGLVVRLANGSEFQITIVKSA